MTSFGLWPVLFWTILDILTLLEQCKVIPTDIILYHNIRNVLHPLMSKCATETGIPKQKLCLRPSPRVQKHAPPHRHFHLPIPKRQMRKKAKRDVVRLSSHVFTCGEAQQVKERGVSSSSSSFGGKESHRVTWRPNWHGINGNWTYQVHQ